MTAVNMHIPLDFIPVHAHHSRSNSISSNSTHSNHSRPVSSHGLPQIQRGMPVTHDDLFRATYGHPQIHDQGPHRNSHYRARVASSPYPRDTDSVHSSSSETEDMALYLGAQNTDYSAMYANQHIQPSQDAIHATGAFGRMNISSADHGLENLAAKVRAATTTSASDRAKQIFVQAWLTANYATYPDGNVPRQGLYFSYRRVCDQYGIPHINTATLGKAIRLCFPTIKTRRLGVRGNSKYHYCGIRPATAAEAEWLHDYVTKTNAQASAARSQKEGEADKDNSRSDDDDDEDSEGGNSAAGSKRNSLVLPGEVKNSVFGDELSDKTPTVATLLSQQAAHRPTAGFHEASIRRHAQQQEPAITLQAPSPASSASYLAPQQPTSVRRLPLFPNIEEAIGSDRTAAHNVAALEIWGWFQDHLDGLLESIRTFRFDQFEMSVRNFWTTLQGNHRELVHAPAIAGLMARADAIVYDEILEFLRLQMLSPISTSSLNSLRQLAIKMEKILLVALEGYGNTFVEPKVELGARFGHLVLRFLDIYQVTQALNTVLTNQKQVAEMRRSWTKVDFESVRNQSALVCNCRHEDLVQLLEVEFAQLLDTVAETNEPVREVMQWADKCCERLMGGVRANQVIQEERGVMSSRSVLIRWGYVTSQVMRDLTIRSDPAFGAFQILKLFLDDWIAVNVLRNVALSTNSVAASVEPMMQQNFFSLSPMAGQESFGNLDVRAGAPGMQMQHTPTTSSMLAALQQDTTFSGLDATGGFGNDAYSAMSFMDTSASQEDALAGGHQTGLSFSDFSSSANPFDHSAFPPPELGGIRVPGTPSNDTDQDAGGDSKGDRPAI